MRVGMACNIHVAQLSNVENRRIQVFPRYLKRLSEFYGVAPEFLVDGEGFARKSETASHE